MNKIKLSFGDRNNYTWVENENATVCRIKCEIKIDNVCDKYQDKLQKLFPHISFNYFNNIIRFTSTGVAKLSPDDKYNKTLGRHIAEARAKQKAYSVANRVIRTYYDILNEDMDVLYDFIGESTYQYAHEEEHIEYLIEKGE